MSGLPDHVGSDCRLLFVGMNPGLRSAAKGHHFAGHSNRFWPLMAAAGFVPPGSGFETDRDLPAFGLGITNLVARVTSGVGDLGKRDYERGRRALLEKIRRLRPGAVALVGVMVYREVFRDRGKVQCGPLDQPLEGVPCYVVPNPSGRNAHFSYEEMLAEFRRLRRWAETVSGLDRRDQK